MILESAKWAVTGLWRGTEEDDVFDELGQKREALDAYSELLPLYRDLAEREPDAFGPDVGMTLNNLGNVLSDLGRRDDALEAYEEALGIYDKFAQRWPAGV